MTEDGDRFEDNVHMGQIDNRALDNCLRIFQYREGGIVIQLRKDSWYMCRELTDREVLGLIHAVAERLSQKLKRSQNVRKIGIDRP